MIFAGLQPLGIILDEEKNRQRGFEREIPLAQLGLVKIIIIPTNEEYMIALDTSASWRKSENRPRYLALQTISFCYASVKNARR